MRKTLNKPLVPFQEQLLSSLIKIRKGKEKLIIVWAWFAILSIAINIINNPFVHFNHIHHDLFNTANITDVLLFFVLAIVYYTTLVICYYLYKNRYNTNYRGATYLTFLIILISLFVIIRSSLPAFISIIGMIWQSIYWFFRWRI